MEDKDIIQLYWDRNEQAIAETSSKYRDYCYIISDNILHNEEDCEECLNDTWMKTWNSIPSQRPAMFKQFLAKIVRNISFDVYRKGHSQKRGQGNVAVALDELEECVADTREVEAEVIAGQLKDAINKFLESLPVRDRQLFVRRYFFAEDVGTIAQSFSIKESNVLMILSRVRKKLKEYLEKEGYGV